MDTHIINAQEYYLANDVRNLHPSIFTGCLKSMPQFIERNGLSDEEYTWARLVDGCYVKLEMKKSNKIDKLMLSCAWVNSKLGIGESVDEVINNEEPKVEPKNDKNYAPDILDLKDKEKLTDNDGNVYEIEVRGERHPDKIYFKVKDIATLIESHNLSKNILRSDRGYTKNEDYVKFYIVESDTPLEGHGLKKGGNRGRLFFTYAGFLRCIFNSRNKNVNKFRKWATDVVFTSHLSTKSQKQELAAKLLKTDRQTVRAVLSKSTTEQSCIYLIRLGKASDLEEHFGISNYNKGDYVYKYGRAISLSKRLDQHQANYGKYGCNIELAKYAPIDPVYNVDAENDIKSYFVDEGHKLDNKKHIELVVLSKSDLKIVDAKYKEISDKYMGKYTELNNKIKVMKERCRADVAEVESQKNAILAEKNALESELLKQKLKYKKKLKQAKK